MPYWLYSSEGLPDLDLMKKPGYTPEYMQHHGVQVVMPEREWIKLNDNHYILKHRDRSDKAGYREHIAGEDIVNGLRKRFETRGVIFLDHEPSATEKEALAKVSEEINLKFRTDAVDFYEQQRHEKEVSGQGRSRPTPYEDKSYELLKLNKPYSVEAFKALRAPGDEAAKKIADAIVGALAADRAAKAEVTTLADVTQ
jgi:hypothetical protein